MFRASLIFSSFAQFLFVSAFLFLYLKGTPLRAIFSILVLERHLEIKELLVVFLLTMFLAAGEG